MTTSVWMELSEAHLYAVLEAVELPAGIGHLTAGLANVDGNAFPHDGFRPEKFRPDTLWVREENGELWRGPGSFIAVISAIILLQILKIMVIDTQFEEQMPYFHLLLYIYVLEKKKKIRNFLLYDITISCQKWYPFINRCKIAHSTILSIYSVNRQNSFRILF